MRKNNITDIIIIGDTMKKYLVLLILLIIPFYAQAADDNYMVYVDENKNITVTLNNQPISDYSNLVALEDGVLVVKEGAVIERISHNTDLTITSHDKEVTINSFYSENKNTNTSAYKVLNIDHMHNYSTNSYFNYHYSIYINESYFENIKPTSTHYRIADDVGVKITKSTIKGYDSTDFNVWGGNIIIEDTNMEAWIIDANEGSIEIRNSNIKFKAGIYTELPSAHIIIEDSVLDGKDGEYTYIEAQAGLKNSDGIMIKNSTIDCLRIGMSYGIYDENAKNPVLSIINSNIHTREHIRSENTFEFINSNITTNYLLLGSSIPYEKYDSTYSTIKDSIVNVLSGGTNSYTYNYLYGSLVLDNSYLHADGYVNLYYLYLKNSAFILNRANESYYVKNEAIRIQRLLDIDNSYFYVENQVGPSAVWFSPTASINIPNNTFFTDKEYNNLSFNDYTYEDRWGDSISGKAFFLDNNVSSSLLLTTKKKVTFKIQGGTWADGSTDDIVVTKDIWTKLTNEDIPTGMLGDGEGYWKVVPSTDYIKDDLEFVYVFGKVKGEEEVTNPKTGVFTYTFRCLILLAIVFYIYTKVYKKTLFRRY